METTKNNSGKHRRDGETYQITADEVKQYSDLGYLVLKEVLTDNEMKDLDYWFDHFISGKEMHQMDKDFCDMSQPYGTPVEDFQLVNAMCPSMYRPELANNIYFRIAQSIANQLYNEGKAEMDYEQFLAKKPSKKGAEFAMHQDLGYWPKTENTWTATFSLALSDSDIINGCLQVIPGTNKEKELRVHLPKPYHGNEGETMDRDTSHTLVIESRKKDNPIFLPVKRGDVTIHDERIIHGSGGNSSNVWRKTYVMAFRDSETIKQERALGYTHSHNDKLDWKEVLG
ncbi:phytanoyl-CoA dioxygenase family protein [Winogradskyella sp.]|uniref:phytanoyl-CoA dioxygenase family protein n=1 Tax=Winogradskyella sp. TaxID=1883156 RepID=UPI003BA9D0A9